MTKDEMVLADNLAMLVRRMAYRLQRHKGNVGDERLADAALEFLRVNGITGSILREEQP